MKLNKHIFEFKNNTIVVENKKKISRFTALRFLLKEREIFYNENKR